MKQPRVQNVFQTLVNLDSTGATFAIGDSDYIKLQLR